MLIAVVGVVLWRGAFGLLPFERELVWRVPVSYREVRKLEIQLWRGGELLKREERLAPGGLQSEPTSKLTLSRGGHRAMLFAWLAGEAQPRSWTVDFDPANETTVVVEARDRPQPKPPEAAPRQ